MSACSSGASDEQSGAENLGEEAQAVEKTLAEFDTGYGTVRFIETTTASGRVNVGVMEVSPVTYGTTTIESLLAAGHTSLELFMGLMPEREIPESLRAAHDLEVKQLHRASADIIPAVYDANAPIEKYSDAQCTADVFVTTYNGCLRYDYINKRASTHRTGGSAGTPQILNVATDAGAYATVEPVKLAVCNDSNVTIQARVNYKETGIGSSGQWYNNFIWNAVAPQTKATWSRRQWLNERPCSDPEGCISNPYPSYYRVEAYSPVGKYFWLRTGEHRTVSTCPPPVIK